MVKDERGIKSHMAIFKTNHQTVKRLEARSTRNPGRVSFGVPSVPRIQRWENLHDRKPPLMGEKPAAYAFL